VQPGLIFRIIFAVVLTAFVAHRRNAHQKHPPSSEDTVVRGQPKPVELLSKLLGLGALIAGMAYVFYPRLVSWAALPIPTFWRWSGVAVALLGFWLLQRSQQALGDSWSGTTSLKKTQALVTNGPYRRIRHPIYTSFLLILGSLLPISANGVVGALWIGMVVVEVVSRMGVEEAMMMSRFGDSYRVYMSTTGRLLPRIFGRERSSDA
jgi:protein-S-isoprenylcysteine O-methyltransferase Ste14